MFAAVFVFGFLAAVPSVTRAQTATTTFPVKEAGVAAYVKLDNITQASFENAKQRLFDSVASAGDTYMIGLKEYPVFGSDGGKMNFHIYFSTNGWLVIYLLKTEEPSRIVKWVFGAELSDTMLKTIAKEAIEKIGANINALDSLKYYDFSNPQATKMTLVREDFINDGSSLFDNFSVKIPGTLLRASWVMACFNCASNDNGLLGLLVDGRSAGVSGTGLLTYGSYNTSWFNDNASHSVQLNRARENIDARAATVFLYKP